MSANPTAMAPVNRSCSKRTPSVTATAGFTYVITVDRTGPISRMSAKKSRNASAVQTTPSVITAAMAWPDGQACGTWMIAAGA
jgi:hypothetical protein